ncbi:MAG: protein kinase [Deltaproteobacteria bacterium]|nr:protein kinase [Deltaproteobacteria bacterium]
MDLEPLYALASPFGAPRVLAFDHDRRGFVDLHVVPSFVRGSARQRIEREVESCVSVSSPYLAKVIGAVETEAGLAIAYDWRPGVTLAGALAASGRVRVPFRVGTLFVIVSELARALGHLEDLGLAHDNVTTCTVELGFDGRVTLLDLGLSEYCTELLRAGRGDRFRALRFHAPERLMGQRASIRSDIFSAGVVLWESLTGRVLFDGSTADELTRRVIACGAQPPSRLVANVSDTFDNLTLTLLARSPKDRPGSARSFSGSVEVLLRQAGVREGPGAMVHADLSRIFGAEVLSSAIDFAYEARVSSIPAAPIDLLEHPTQPPCEASERDTYPPFAEIVDLSSFRATSSPPPARSDPLPPKALASALLVASGERFRPYSARAH